MLDITPEQSRHYLAREVMQLLDSYLELYNIRHTYHHVTTNGDFIDVVIGIAPYSTEGEGNGVNFNVTARVPGNLEDEIAARECIPKIHAKFIEGLYRQTIEHLYTIKCKQKVVQ